MTEKNVRQEANICVVREERTIQDNVNYLVALDKKDK